MIEEWKPVVGYEGMYDVSNLGKVRRRYKTTPTRLLKLSPHDGYLRAHLCRDNKARMWFVHRLVAEAFIDNPDGKPFVNHIDGNRSNNVVSNLEWVTMSENHRHAFRVLGRQNRKGSQSNLAKLTEDQIYDIRRQASSGVLHRLIAEQYSVCRQTIGDIANGKSWGHIPRKEA